MNTPKTETVQLDTPIQRGEQNITEVALRKPNAGELRGVALTALLAMDVESLVTVVPRISTPTLTTADVRGMDPADLVQIGGAVAGFLLQKRLLEPSQAT
ncbi:phage tail assembly protein [Thauera butanivorans]|uniref:phage tail assembly protein n=1 Tax=Thauera butanivorans TaxID=86174 RepID=UPI000838050B|nr:phage tail assembly protein [Thauera butanivorans]